MSKISVFPMVLFAIILITACSNYNDLNNNLRESFFVKDGFTAEKFDRIMDRIVKEQGDLYLEMNKRVAENEIGNPRMMITPHDDIALVGYIYPSLFQYVKTKTVFIIGVAHKARNFDLEDKLIFDDFDKWDSPKGEVEISEIRNELIENLSEKDFIIHNEMQQIEHSVESVLPYIQYNNPEIEIVSILVPYMNFERMKYLANNLSDAIQKVASKREMVWGTDYSIVISTDAVHYGDKGWSGSNYDRFGVDEVGYNKAVEHEWEIINSSLAGPITEEKVQKFINYTVFEEDYKTYKWTWCGRYCIPFGMLTSKYLAKKMNSEELKGAPLAYSTSIENAMINVDDIVKYEHAQADLHHWVGYPAIVYN